MLIELMKDASSLIMLKENLRLSCLSEHYQEGKMCTVTAREIMNKFRNIIAILRVFAARGQFSYLDRIASALDPNVVDAILYEAVRTYRAMLNSAVKVRVKIDGEERTIIALDWEGPYNSCEEVTARDPRVAMLMRSFEDLVKCGRVLDEVPGLERDKCYVIFTVPVTKDGSPIYPDEREIQELIDLVKEEGMSVVQIITTLALSGLR